MHGVNPKTQGQCIDPTIKLAVKEAKQKISGFESEAQNEVEFDKLMTDYIQSIIREPFFSHLIEKNPAVLTFLSEDEKTTPLVVAALKGFRAYSKKIMPGIEEESVNESFKEFYKHHAANDLNNPDIVEIALRHNGYDYVSEQLSPGSFSNPVIQKLLLNAKPVNIFNGQFNGCIRDKETALYVLGDNPFLWYMLSSELQEEQELAQIAVENGICLSRMPDELQSNGSLQAIALDKREQLSTEDLHKKFQLILRFLNNFNTLCIFYMVMKDDKRNVDDPTKRDENRIQRKVKDIFTNEMTDFLQLISAAKKQGLDEDLDLMESEAEACLAGELKAHDELQHDRLESWGHWDAPLERVEDYE